MAVYAIADLHLSEGVNKPMDVFGGAWRGHREKVEKELSRFSEEDLLVIAGDFSWGISLAEALPDFRFLDQFCGKKLLLKGNHDLWWETVSKMNRFLKENEIKSIEFLHNNSIVLGKTGLCGTRGWFFNEEKNEAHDQKMIAREVMRLEMSIRHAKDQGAEELIAFLHYPPLGVGFLCAPIIETLKKYGVSRCYYGHLHGGGHHMARQGVIDGVEYRLISADYLAFRPALLKLND